MKANFSRGASWVAGRTKEEAVLRPFHAGFELTRRITNCNDNKFHISINGRPLSDSYRTYVYA